MSEKYDCEEELGKILRRMTVKNNWKERLRRMTGENDWEQRLRRMIGKND